MGGKRDMRDFRFVIEHAGDPEYSLVTRSSDGQMLFLANKLSKMKQSTALGSRIAELHNGSSLFTGDAGQGESNIRRWIIENDWLEAIVALPLNMFYNTDIATYVWMLTNRKPQHRQGKVQLIDATGWSRPLRKNLGKKNCELSEEDIVRICDIFLSFEESKQSKILDNAALGYWKVTVECPLRIKGADPNRAYKAVEITKPTVTGKRSATAPPVILRSEYPRVKRRLIVELMRSDSKLKRPALTTDRSTHETQCADSKEIRSMKLLKYVIYPAAALALGSVGTLFFENWTDRARLFVAIEEVGFVGSSDYLEVSPKLREWSEDDQWFDDVDRYVQWSTLSERYESIALIKGNLEVAINVVEEWYENQLDETDKVQLSKKELADYPYARGITYAIFDVIMKAGIRRREIGSPPISLSEMESYESVVEYTNNSDMWQVFGDTWIIPISRSYFITEDRESQGEILVRSLVHGVRQNLIYYADKFIEIASKDVRHLNKIEAEILETLYPETRLISKVSVFNSGNKPVVLRPYGVVEVLNEGLDIPHMIMEINPVLPSTVASTFEEILNYMANLNDKIDYESNETSRQVDVQPLLPVKGKVKYVMVPPSDEVTIRLISRDVLSDFGTILLKAYDLDLLELRVRLYMLEGDSIQSDGVVFGASLPDDVSGIAVDD